MIVYRSASNYEEKWGFFSQIKQKMKYKSKYAWRTSLALQWSGPACKSVDKYHLHQVFQ